MNKVVSVDRCHVGGARFDRDQTSRPDRSACRGGAGEAEGGSVGTEVMEDHVTECLMCVDCEPPSAERSRSLLQQCKCPSRHVVTMETVNRKLINC